MTHDQLIQRIQDMIDRNNEIVRQSELITRVLDEHKQDNTPAQDRRTA